jgi:hypothetical protein
VIAVTTLCLLCSIRRGCRLIRLLILLGLCCGCSTIPLQRRMAALAQDAVKACKSDSSRCADAAVCAHAALDASKALQNARSATATGTVDNDAAYAAATLPSLAEGLCVGVTAPSPQKDKVKP